MINKRQKTAAFRLEHASTFFIIIQKPVKNLLCSWSDQVENRKLVEKLKVGLPDKLSRSLYIENISSREQLTPNLINF